MSLWKTDIQLPLTYLGTWNANTNSPALSNGSGDANDFYVVGTAGSTALDGVNSWAVGDWVLSTGTVWTKIPNASAVSSVAGKTGAVTLDKADITDFTETDYVHVSGDETVAGVKTFSSFPVTPSAAPTTNYQTANKKYVNDQDAIVTDSVTIVANALSAETTNRINGDAEAVKLTGDQTIAGAKKFSQSITLSKASGAGLLVDPDSPTYGWKDLIGNMLPDPAGGDAPSLAVYRGGLIRRYAYSAGDKMDMEYHLLHDYAPGTDLYFHIHWSHNGTAISGNFVATIAFTYSKGYNQSGEIFSVEKTATLTYNTVNIATTPRWTHMITEIQLSTAGGAADKLDTNLIEVDSVIGVNMTMTTIPTITGGSPNEPFIFFNDIHYQSTQTATKGRNIPFYT